NMNMALQAWEEGSLQTAQDLLVAHEPLPGREDLRGFEWRYLRNLCQDESSHTFSNLVFKNSTERGLILGADAQSAIAVNGGSLHWLDFSKKRQTMTMSLGPIPISGLSMAVDQPGLVAYRTDRIRAFSPASDALLGSGLDPSWGPVFALSWDGKWLAAGGTNCSVGVFEVASGKQIGPTITFEGQDQIKSLSGC
ncbi:MAG: hypothetical protein M3Q12_13580, partial [Pseudomonadota bacterium]|nr:hypothetical protein [Pseudomonadota bacterium]